MRKALVLVLAGLAVSCGSGTDAEFTLSSGEYAISNFSPVSDQCNVASGFTDPTSGIKQFGVTVTGTTVKVFTDIVAANKVPSGTLAANAFSMSYNDTADYPPDCTENQKTTFAGTLTANDDMTMTFTFEASASGTQCGVSVNGWSGTSCKSEFTFNAAKK